MARPTRYCKNCGEYVTDAVVTIGLRTGYERVVKKLIHIDGSGKELHRRCKAEEEAHG